MCGGGFGSITDDCLYFYVFNQSGVFIMEVVDFLYVRVLHKRGSAQ